MFEILPNEIFEIIADFDVLKKLILLNHEYNKYASDKIVSTIVDYSLRNPWVSTRSLGVMVVYEVPHFAFLYVDWSFDDPYATHEYSLLIGDDHTITKTEFGDWMVVFEDTDDNNTDNTTNNDNATNDNAIAGNNDDLVIYADITYSALYNEHTSHGENNQNCILCRNQHACDNESYYITDISAIMAAIRNNFGKIPAIIKSKCIRRLLEYIDNYGESVLAMYTWMHLRAYRFCTIDDIAVENIRSDILTNLKMSVDYACRIVEQL